MGRNDLDEKLLTIDNHPPKYKNGGIFSLLRYFINAKRPQRVLWMGARRGGKQGTAAHYSETLHSLIPPQNSLLVGLLDWWINVYGWMCVHPSLPPCLPNISAWRGPSLCHRRCSAHVLQACQCCSPVVILWAWVVRKSTQPYCIVTGMEENFHFVNKSLPDDAAIQEAEAFPRASRRSNLFAPGQAASNVSISK